MNQKVIYTAIFGDYEGLLPQKKLAGWDFVCFTDNPSLKASSWQIRLIDPPVPGDNTRSNRYIKINPHLFFPAYEISIFVDGNILVIGNLDKLVETVLADHTMACFDHGQAKLDPRNCIYSEYDYLKQLAEQQGVYKDDPQVMEKHIGFLRAEGYPEQAGLIVGTVLIRRHRDPKLIQVMEDWWYMVKSYSRRDQLSFNYVAWKNQFTYRVIPGDIRRGNGYFYMLGKHRKDWSDKLWKFRWKKRLGLVKIYK
ncbi:glycosyltransferase domain-containing protein [Parapedobacter indicus]|uniref:TOD1/MUCI70 glycosyltransferase-like domain-containing protein n=1 Tax=Parapedobacter indicus TaxID=1477437 RepID=A0A1I3PP70_9SPHI|nr:glycosyltransferase domain-containing protein [Parapedobacter indicus]PPL00531.1 uncharacterized protein DUF616 [Parapedobacter indicus]SFJ23574.1 Protein of unknown function [Parapedobacter indicus]